MRWLPQMPTVTEGTSISLRPQQKFLVVEQSHRQETPSARPSSTVAEASTATSEVAKLKYPQVSQASSTTPGII